MSNIPKFFFILFFYFNPRHQFVDIELNQGNRLRSAKNFPFYNFFRFSCKIWVLDIIQNIQTMKTVFVTFFHCEKSKSYKKHVSIHHINKPHITLSAMKVFCTYFSYVPRSSLLSPAAISLISPLITR